MFIQMSNEQFRADYENKKIFISKANGGRVDEDHQNSYHHNKFASPGVSPNKFNKPQNM